MSNPPGSSTSSSNWEPPLPEELQAMLPQYEVTGILGRGGMGAVYRGIQRNLDRPVAIKVLPETFSQGADELNFVARFKQEARAMAKMAHPAIISVYDFGETANGQLYFVMEYIDGMDIHRYAQEHGGRLPQEHALAIVAHVLDALEYAHHQGIVHRDIKPANILINREGRVKIADFGLAKKFGSGADQSQAALTLSNVAVGTPDFVAPESLEAGRTVDHRADLYAVGVMLYQLLTGKLPRGQFKSPSEMVAGLDPRLDAIVSRAMQTEPEDRYPSAAAVRADLDVIFSRPMARVEAGAETEDIPVAVPVTTSVKEGARAGKAVAGSAKRPPTPGAAKPRAGSQADRKAAEKAEARGGSKRPLIIGVSAVAAVVVGLVVYGLNREPEPQPAASKAGASSAPSETRVTASSVTENLVRIPEPSGGNGKTKVERPQEGADIAPQTPIPKESPGEIPQSGDQAIPTSQWVKVFDRFEDLPNSMKLPDSGWVVEEGWLRQTDPQKNKHFMFPGFEARQAAVRAKLRITEDEVGALLLNGDPGGFKRPGHHRLKFLFGRWLLEKTSAPLGTGFATVQQGEYSNGTESEVIGEFAIIGTKLYVKINGELVATSSDEGAVTGKVGFYGGSRIRDIEAINLDGLPETEALKLIGVDAEGNDLRAPAMTKTADPAAQSPGAPGSSTSADRSTFPPGQWVNTTEAVLRARKDMERQPDGWILRKSGNDGGPFFLGPSGLNQGGRCKLKASPNMGRPEISLERSGKDLFGLTLSHTAKEACLKRRDLGDLATLKTLALAKPIADGDEYTVEIYRVGDRLIGRIRDQVMVAPLSYEGTAPSLAARIAAPGREYLVRDIEVINLDGLPEAEALRLAGIDENGNDLRALAAKEEQRMMEQAKAAETLASVPELNALHEQFLALEAERVTKVFAADLTALNASYTGGIDRAIADAKKAGSLDTVLALEQEKARIAASESVPAEDEATAPEPLKKLRVIYRDSLAKLEAARAANRKTLTDPLIARLKQLESELTRQDRIEHAKTVREYQNRLEAPPTPAPPDSPATPSAGQAGDKATMPSSQVETVSDRVRPDPKRSRAAAEYALNVGASVTIMSRGSATLIQAGGKLPADDFELHQVSFPGSKGLPITDADLSAITEASELRRFSTGDQNQSEITTLAPFQKTPQIEEINCYHFGILTENECAILASLPNLKRFNVLGRSDPVENLPLLLSAPALENISFSGGRLGPEDGAVLNRFPKLRRLTISAANMDGILRQMGGMDQVELLAMSHTTVSEAGLGALNAGLADTLENLTFGKPTDDTSAVAAFAFQRFPKLKTVGFRGEISAEAFAGLKNLAAVGVVTFNNVAMTPSHFDTLGECRALTEITIGAGNMTTGDLAALRRLRNLKTLLIKDNGIRIDPAAIPDFAKLDTLTKLELPVSQVTEAQFAELRKALPNCEMTRVKAYQ